jgi:hypothetical protein
MLAWGAILLIAIGLWPVWQVVFDPATNWAKGDPTLLLVWTAPFVVPALLVVFSKASMALAWLAATVPVLLYAWIWFRALPDPLYGIVWIFVVPIACLLVVGPGGLFALLIIRHVRRRNAA